MTYQLRPAKISQRSYHDFVLTGIQLDDDELRIDVRQPETAEKYTITLSQVRLLIVNNLILGNIIESIDCHTIDQSNENIIINQLLETKSEYVGKDQLSAIFKSRKAIGNRYVTVNPTYGAELYSICGVVSENIASIAP